MNSRIPSTILIGMILIASCGANHRVQNIYFEFKKPSVRTANGFFNVTLNPSPKHTTDGDRDIITWSDPYTFSTQYISIGGNFINGRISDLTISSARSGKIVYRTDLIQDTFSKTRPDDQFTVSPKEIVGFGAGPMSLPYDDYRISFDFVIFGESATIYDNGKVSVIVKKKFSEEMH